MSQQTKEKFFYRATSKQRLFAGLVLVGIICFFIFLWLAAAEKIDPGFIFGQCGFKQRYHLPCMGCGMTTSAVAFVKGEIGRSFYIQPAAGLFCGVFVIAGFLAFLTAVFGVYFSFLKRFAGQIKIRYLIMAIIFIFAAAWAVTLARALAARGN